MGLKCAYEQCSLSCMFSDLVRLCCHRKVPVWHNWQCYIVSVLIPACGFIVAIDKRKSFIESKGTCMSLIDKMHILDTLRWI